MLDTQCIEADIINEALTTGSVVITTSDETVMGLPDISSLNIDNLAEILFNDRCGFIKDKRKAAEAVIELEANGKRQRKRKRETTQNYIQNTIRTGRGPITDREIRTTAPSIIMGEIPV